VLWDLICSLGGITLELIECLEKRCSVRDFTKEDVPDDILMGALWAANLAPSAGNQQSRDFIIVRDADIRYHLAKAAHDQHFLSEAPVLIVCCANMDRIIMYGSRGRELYCLQDVAAAIENMLLYVTCKGYGSCWVGAMDEKRVAKILLLPPHVRPVAIIAIGRARRSCSKPPRVEIERLVHWEKW